MTRSLCWRNACGCGLRPTRVLPVCFCMGADSGVHLDMGAASASADLATYPLVWAITTRSMQYITGVTELAQTAPAFEGVRFPQDLLSWVAGG